MVCLKKQVKQIPLVKKYRVEKWKHFAKRTMFTANEITWLENNPQKIPEAVRKHIKRTAAVSDDIEKELDVFLSKSYLAGESKVSGELKMDMLFWHFAYGFSFNEYLCYRFIDKSREERMEFLSDRDSVQLGYDMNDIDGMAVFGDKMNTYKKFRSYYGRDAISLESVADFKKYQAFINNHAQFVKKNVFQACGKSIELIDTKSSCKSERELFSCLLSEGKVILEEVVRQSPEIAVFNASSVNTVRCITLKTSSDVLVPYCFMKIGRDGAFVDNGGAGGVLVGIDVATGILGTDGVDENGIRYERHPDSNVVFKGFQLPAWLEMKTMCKQMAEMTPSVRLIGWDMAYTKEGWIVIEGNAMTEVIGPQSTWQRGIRKDFKALNVKM